MELSNPQTGHIGDTQGEYSVCQFFPSGDYEYVRRYVSAEEAVKVAHHYCTSVGARIGTTVRVIITDGGDCTNFDWEFGKGVVFPTKEECKITSDNARPREKKE